jgi:4-hydroxy-3-methylbut-2-en-1-yl diphosphate synthase IspG/GcpE
MYEALIISPMSSARLAEKWWHSRVFLFLGWAVCEYRVPRGQESERHALHLGLTDQTSGTQERSSINDSLSILLQEGIDDIAS